MMSQLPYQKAQRPSQHSQGEAMEARFRQARTGRSADDGTPHWTNPRTVFGLRCSPCLISCRRLHRPFQRLVRFAKGESSRWRSWQWDVEHLGGRFAICSPQSTTQTSRWSPHFLLLSPCCLALVLRTAFDHSNNTGRHKWKASALVSAKPNDTSTKCFACFHRQSPQSVSLPRRHRTATSAPLRSRHLKAAATCKVSALSPHHRPSGQQSSLSRQCSSTADSCLPTPRAHWSPCACTVKKIAAFSRLRCWVLRALKKQIQRD